jgi:alanine racemase
MTPYPAPVSEPNRSEDCALLTVDLSALRRNWRELARLSAPAQCAAAIKADAYGLGLEPAMRVMLAEGCTTFFVATLSEAVRARTTSREATIYLLNGLAQGSPAALKAMDLRPVLNELAEVAEWAEAGAGAAALHFDTGMNRLGLAPRDFARAAELAQRFAPSLVMSHFVAAGRLGDAMNDLQIARLASLRENFPGVPASLANSSGIFLPQRPLLDLTRPGYAIYGGNPVPGGPNPMQPVVRLSARILAARQIATGESVGYDAAWIAARPTALATIGLGYADGLPIGASNGPGNAAAQVLVGGRLCPFVGRISMDLAVLDVTDAPAGAAARGEWVEILGSEIGVDDLAERSQTIGYEILTRLGRRYARSYVGG